MTQAQVIARLRAARRTRGWSTQRLAEQCAELGMAELDRSRIASIETGRRHRLGVDELLIMATALDLSPGALLDTDHRPKETCAVCGEDWPCATSGTPAEAP